MTSEHELSILWAWGIAIAAGVFVYWAVSFHVVRTIARWLGQRLATWFYGNGRPR